MDVGFENESGTPDDSDPSAGLWVVERTFFLGVEGGLGLEEEEASATEEGEVLLAEEEEEGAAAALALVALLSPPKMVFAILGNLPESFVLSSFSMVVQRWIR